MAGHEEVVGAFFRIGVSHQAALGPNRSEAGEPTGDQFMGIDLMPSVPDEPVAAEIKNAVQGQAQFHHPQVGGEVGGAGSSHFTERPPHFGGQLLQLLWGKPAEVCRRENGGEDFGHMRNALYAYLWETSCVLNTVWATSKRRPGLLCDMPAKHRLRNLSQIHRIPT